MKKIYIDENRVIKLIEMPEEPKLNMLDAYGDDRDKKWSDPLQKYSEAIAQAKKDAVSFKEQNTPEQACEVQMKLKAMFIFPDSIHDIPTGLDAEVKEEYRVVMSHCASEWSEKYPKFLVEDIIETRKTAFLKNLSPQPVEDMENTDELRHVLQQIQNAIEGEPHGLKEAWNLLSNHITNLESPQPERTAAEIFKKHSDEAMGEVCPQDDWDRLMTEDTDEGKLFRAVLKAMQEYRDQLKGSEQ